MIRARQIAGEILRKEAKAGIGKGLVAATKGFFGAGKNISKEMARHGVESPLAHGVAKVSPYAAALVGAEHVKEKVEQSPSFQKLRYKLHERRQRKAMERAQRGGY